PLTRSRSGTDASTAFCGRPIARGQAPLRSVEPEGSPIRRGVVYLTGCLFDDRLASRAALAVLEVRFRDCRLASTARRFRLAHRLAPEGRLGPRPRGPFRCPVRERGVESVELLVHLGEFFVRPATRLPDAFDHERHQK